MKRIEGIDTKPEHYQDDVTPDVMEKMPTFRKMFIALAGGGSAKGQEEAMDIQQIVLKLRVLNSDGDYVDLEDAQMRLLRKKVEENTANYTAFFLAQLFEKMTKAKDPKGKE